MERQTQIGITVGLFAFGEWISYSVGRIGLMPLDHSIVFDGAWRVLSGQVRVSIRPIQRVHIPKEGGKTRPIGVSAFEDQIVQDALREVLEAIYDQNFLDCS